MDRIDNQEKNISPTPTKLEEFTTELWEHPLVDDATRQHRACFVSACEEAIRKMGDDPINYICVPVGSIIWLTDQKSDFDIKIFSLLGAKFQGLDLAFDLPKIDRRLNQTGIIWPLDKQLSAKRPQIQNLFSLLITPDKYIAGSKQIVAEARMKVASIIENASSEERMMFEKEFNEFMAVVLGWNTMRLKGALPDYFSKRPMRYSRRLIDMAKDQPNSEKLLTKLVAHMKNRHAPSLDEIVESIKATQGRIN